MYYKLLFTTLFAATLLLSDHVQANPDKKNSYVSGKRDPFWPVGFQPNLPKPAPKPIETRRLTEAELRELARRQQEQLKKLLDLNGSISKSGKRYILINNNLVTTGDVLEIVVGGEVYKLMVKSLSSDNIQLEPLAN